jgi:hypothetical protein
MCSFLVSAQDNPSEKVDWQKIQSALIEDGNKILEKHEAKSKVKTRGAASDPCEEDLDRLLSLFAQFKTNYMRCCENRLDGDEVYRILYQIKAISDNSQCAWEDHTEMYAILAFKVLEYANFVDSYDCNRKCECGGCD